MSRDGGAAAALRHEPWARPHASGRSSSVAAQEGPIHDLDQPQEQAKKAGSNDHGRGRPRGWHRRDDRGEDQAIDDRQHQVEHHAHGRGRHQRRAGLHRGRLSSMPAIMRGGMKASMPSRPACSCRSCPRIRGSARSRPQQLIVRAAGAPRSAHERRPCRAAPAAITRCASWCTRYARMPRLPRAGGYQEDGGLSCRNGAGTQPCRGPSGVSART